MSEKQPRPPQATFAGALIIGGSLAGFLGVLLSVPLAAATREFIADLEKRKRAHHPIPGA